MSNLKYFFPLQNTISPNSVKNKLEIYCSYLDSFETKKKNIKAKDKKKTFIFKKSQSMTKPQISTEVIQIYKQNFLKNQKSFLKTELDNNLSKEFDINRISQTNLQNQIKTKKNKENNKNFRLKNILDQSLKPNQLIFDSHFSNNLPKHEKMKSRFIFPQEKKVGTMEKGKSIFGTKLKNIVQFKNKLKNDIENQHFHNFCDYFKIRKYEIPIAVSIIFQNCVKKKFPKIFVLFEFQKKKIFREIKKRPSFIFSEPKALKANRFGKSYKRRVAGFAKEISLYPLRLDSIQELPIDNQEIDKRSDWMKIIEELLLAVDLKDV